MSKMVKTKMCMALLAGACACVAGGVVFGNKTVQADANSTDIFVMEHSSSIRLDANGLRFRAKMSESVVNTLSADNKDLYFIIMPENFLTYVQSGTTYDFSKAITRDAQGNFDEDNSNCYYIRVDDNWYQEKGYYYANGGIANINDMAGYTKDWVAVACIETKVSETYSYQYASYEESVGQYPITSQYDTLVNALLSETDYTQAISTQYSWFGAEDCPVVVEDNATYSALVNKMKTSTNTKALLENMHLTIENTVSNYDANDFADFDNVTVEKSLVQIERVEDLQAITSASNKIYQLQTSLTVNASATATITELNGTLDLNGHSLTYEVAGDCAPFIGAGAGMVINGFVNVEDNGMAYSSATTLLSKGTVTFENVEMNLALSGACASAYVQVVSNAVRLNKVVIHADVASQTIGLTYDGDAVVVAQPATMHTNNVIVIGNLLYGAHAWSLGVNFDGTLIVPANGGLITKISVENLVNTKQFANVGTFTTSGFDTSVFVANGWNIHPLTKLPTLEDVAIGKIDSVEDLKAITNESGKFYQLQKDLTVSAGTAPVINELNASLDLNGHSLTYEVAGSNAPFIGGGAGMVYNGVVNIEDDGTAYAQNATLLSEGTVTFKDIELNLTLNGVVNANYVQVVTTGVALNNVVIHAHAISGQNIGLTYDGDIVSYAKPVRMHTNNVIVIGNLLYGAHAWGLGIEFDGTLIVPANGGQITKLSVENLVNTKQFASVGAFTANGFDISSFDTSIWNIHPLTKLPMMAELEIIKITTVEDLKAITNESGKYYQLQQSLTVSAGADSVISELNSTLDLNGYSLTCEIAGDCAPVIGGGAGLVYNGVVNVEDDGTAYSGYLTLLAGGSVTFQDVEMHLDLSGACTNFAAIVSTSVSLNNVVIYADVANEQIALTYDGGVVDSANKVATMNTNNVIVIGALRYSSYIWNVGITFEGNAQNGNTVSMANLKNTKQFANVGEFTADNFDTTAFNNGNWDIDETTGLPSVRKQK